MVAIPGGPSWYPKVALITLIVAFFLYLVAFGSPHWCKVNDNRAESTEHIGLWKYCNYPYGGGQTCSDFIDIIVGDWLHAAQSFMTLSLFTFLAAMGIVVILAFVEDLSRDMRVFGAALACVGVTVLFLMIGIGSYGAKCHEYFDTKQESWVGVREYDWSFYLALTSMILTLGALVLLIIDLVLGQMEKEVY